MNCKTSLYSSTHPPYLDGLQFFPELHAQILPASASLILCLHKARALQGSSYGSTGQERPFLM